MTRDRRRALEARIIADRKRNAEPEPFTRVVRGPKLTTHTAQPTPVYTTPADGPGAVPRRRP